LQVKIVDGSSVYYGKNENKLPKYIAPKIIYIGKETSLNDLVKTFKVYRDDVAAINEIYDKGILSKQKIILPNYILHKIRKGDTLYKLSREYTVDVSEIIHYNNIKNAKSLAVGKLVKIVIERNGYENYSTNNENSINKNKLQIKHINKEKQPKLVENNKEIDHKISFIPPLKGKIITKFGKDKNGEVHKGIRIAHKQHHPIKAAAEGVVVYKGGDIPGYGNMVIIKHKNNYYTTYAHQHAIKVVSNQKIKAGQTIGTVGQTGAVSQPQLYFSINQGGNYINPTKLVNLK
jgi:murein DD-endopeptidase MepM/ murein hydrolase activator NlpD